MTPYFRLAIGAIAAVAACVLLLLPLQAHAATPPTCWPSDIGGKGGPADWTWGNKQGPAAGWRCPDGTTSLYAVRWGDVSADLGKALDAFTAATDKQAAAAALNVFVTRSRTDVFDVWQQWAVWKPVATEGQLVKLSDADRVGGLVLRYGGDGHWIIKPVWGDVACTNDVFTDPAVGVGKVCQYAVYQGQPIPVVAPVYTHKVKPNGTSADRPVYALSASGVRGTTAIPNVRAAVLTDGKPTPCDPTKAQSPSGTSTTDVYSAYAPAFAASAVTLCTRVTP